MNYLVFPGMAKNKRRVIIEQVVMPLMDDNFNLRFNRILEAIEAITTVTREEIVGPKRTPLLTFSRCVIAEFMHIPHVSGYLKVAHALNRTDHTTVMHYINKALPKFKNDPEYKEIYDMIRSYL